MDRRQWYNDGSRGSYWLMRDTGDGYVCVSLKVGVYVLTGSRRFVDNKTKWTICSRRLANQENNKKHRSEVSRRLLRWTRAWAIGGHSRRFIAAMVPTERILKPSFLQFQLFITPTVLYNPEKGEWLVRYGAYQRHLLSLLTSSISGFCALSSSVLCSCMTTTTINWWRMQAQA